ncbi:organic anion transporter 3-like [Brevipalpus obovatus]|uniref:organic anion transporter 3-like n=1 Tax=Brevipalpus obovatus TaxID=246614 RepID=UPI003D9F3E30
MDVPKPQPRGSISLERIEHVSDLIGSWGRLQLRLFLLVASLYIAAPLNNFSLYFYVIKMDFWCVGPDNEILSEPNQCDFPEAQTCPNWHYNGTRKTVIREWNLVCDRSRLLYTALSAYQVGYMVSGFLVGYISDKFGRKKGIIVSLIIEMVCSAGLSLAPNIYLFIFIRFVHGIGGYGRYLSSILLMVESVGPKLRGKVLVAFEWIFHLSGYSVIFLTYWVQNYRHIYASASTLSIFSIFMASLAEESPRWQLTQGRTDEARKTLLKYSNPQTEEEKRIFEQKMNKLKQFLDKTHSDSSGNLVDIWRVSRLRNYCFLAYFLWFSTAFSAYALSYSTLDITGSPFTNRAILGLSGIFSTIYLQWRVEKHGRRSLISFCLFSMFLVMLSLAIVGDSARYATQKMGLLLLGEFFITTAFSLLYIYTSEMYPTSLRHVGVGSCSFFARIGTIISPFMGELTRKESIGLTWGTISVISFLGGMSVLFLPETRGREMPDTVEDMLEMTDKKANSPNPS